VSEPKFKPGDRFMGRISGLTGEVTSNGFKAYQDATNWTYKIRYDQPHLGSRDSEAVESNMEPIEPEPEFKAGDYVRLIYSRRIARLETPASGEEGAWEVTIVRDEDGSVQSYASTQHEAVMVPVPDPNPPKPEPTNTERLLAALDVLAKARIARDDTYAKVRAVEEALSAAQREHRESVDAVNRADSDVNRALMDCEQEIYDKALKS
jgi:hypothetical protein